jgi:hypothetical protein
MAGAFVADPVLEIPMIAKLCLFLAFVPLFAVFAKSADSPQDTSQIPQPQNCGRNSLSIGIGLPSPGSDAAGGWRSTNSLRAGFTTEVLTSVFAVSGYVEYYGHRAIIGDHLGPASLSPSFPRRTDVAVYATISCFHVLEFGAGTYYTKSDAVFFVDEFQNRSPWRDSGLSELRAFYTAELKYSIPLSQSVFLPVGFFYRNSYDVNNTLPVYLRIGLGIRL